MQCADHSSIATAVLPVPIAMEQAALAFEDRIDDTIDGDMLVIMLALAFGVIRRREKPARCIIR